MPKPKTEALKKLIDEFDIGDRYFDRSGKPLVNTVAWAKLAEDPKYKRVKQTLIVGKGYEYWISTVWLGLNHNFGLGPPLIFETMVFAKPDSMDDSMDVTDGEWMDRYSTEAQAVKGHKKMVERVLAHLPPDVEVKEGEQ